MPTIISSRDTPRVQRYRVSRILPHDPNSSIPSVGSAVVASTMARNVMAMIRVQTLNRNGQRMWRHWPNNLLFGNYFPTGLVNCYHRKQMIYIATAIKANLAANPIQ